MDILIHTLFETEWGIITIGIFIIGALLIEFFNNKPKS